MVRKHALTLLGDTVRIFSRELESHKSMGAFAAWIVAIGIASTVWGQQPPPPPAASASATNAAPTNPTAKPSLNFEIRQTNERLEMTVHSSRILTMGQKIPQAQVNNPDLLEITPLSPNQIQISAKATGVTQVNLWGEDQKLYTVDVLIIGDASELDMLLKSSFPSSALKVTPVGQSVMISGFVSKPEEVERIVRVAEEYYPKVLNNMTVSGVQQVLLHVKVMEVSRTKLRKMGMDFAQMSGSSGLVSGLNGLLQDHAPDQWVGNPSQQLVTRTTSPTTFSFGVVSGNNSFFAVLDALRQDNLMKVMAEPTLVTINGRPATFNSGGEIAVPQVGSTGTPSAEWKKYGTNIQFVPIILGGSRLRLEVRPNISELDYSNTVTVGGTVLPSIRSRDADTAVEMNAGQTLALAGLVQQRAASVNYGLPWISEVPYIGLPFRKVKEEINEVELLIMVTPELVEAMDAEQVPQCGPGMQTTSPNDWDFYMKGHLETPNCCPNYKSSTSDKTPNTQSAPGMIGPEQIEAPDPSSKSNGGKQPIQMTRRPTNRYDGNKASGSAPTGATASPDGAPGFIGPVGY